MGSLYIVFGDALFMFVVVCNLYVPQQSEMCHVSLRLICSIKMFQILEQQHLPNIIGFLSE
jgi:hypothetical protein